jgi:Tfp pilus assembly PilM family ATPase
MRSRARTLPLGVDIGARRVRVALFEHPAGSPANLLAVAARDHLGDPARALGALLRELPARERRCVLAMTRPEAILHAIDLPPMPPGERRTAARFEAARFVDYPLSEAAVSLVSAGAPHTWALGVVRRAALATTLNVAKHAGLRPLAVDDGALAFRRAHPEADGVIDVGDRATRLVVHGTPVPFVARFEIGGATFTAAIAQALGLDPDAAERRKHSVGFAGAGERVRDELVTWLAGAILEARHAGFAPARTFVLCGNGSRVGGLDAAMRQIHDCEVVAASLPPGASTTLPADVLRAAAPDWSLAFGLGLWGQA